MNFDLKQNGSQEENIKPIDEISNKTKGLEKKLFRTEDDLRAASETILMLENKLESKALEIEILTDRMGNKETLYCENCEVPAKTVNDVKAHTTKYSDENTPSTSNCGKCPYQSDDEEDMNLHINLNHKVDTQKFSCELCRFESNENDDLTKHMDEMHSKKCDHCPFTAQCTETLVLHMNESHKFRCNKCKLAHNDEWKHTIHICKVDIENPTFRSLYCKAWLDQNGCNPIYCLERSEDILWLHNDKCWSGDIPCTWTPHLYVGKPPEVGAPKHLEYAKFVEDNTICWSALSIKIKE